MKRREFLGTTLTGSAVLFAGSTPSLVNAEDKTRMDKNKTKSAKAAWTVMVYMAGDNNLTDEFVLALKDMKKVTQDERVNIVAQFDPSDDYLPTRRFKINPNPSPGTLLADELDAARQQSGRSSTGRLRRWVTSSVCSRKAS